MASLFGKIFRTLVVERQARKKTLSQLIEDLEASGEKLLTQIADAQDSAENRRALSHAIGIERWGQSRLKVFLGEPFIAEEYNRYRPGREVGFSDLVAQFEETRTETLAIARQISTQSIGLEQKVEHNNFGELTANGWLYYLDIHAPLELRKVTT